MRIIATMTTIPSRIDGIRPVIEAVLAQTVPIEHIELNIPYTCIRTGESYAVPEWLESMHRVQIFRTEDYGPITKVAPPSFAIRTTTRPTFGPSMMGGRPIRAKTYVSVLHAM